MKNSSDYRIETLISEEEIKQIVKKLAQQIQRDYKGEEIILAGVLDGAYAFLDDLSRELHELGMKNLIIDFVGMDTYGEGEVSSKEPRITKDLKHDIKDKHLLLVEDIVDTGYSLSVLQSMLKARLPKSLQCAALLSKEARREIQVEVKYIGKAIPDIFVVGYGLDFEGKYLRELPYIGVVKFD
jgi:hypoxanthine phosphoribosyltransferase